MSRGDGTDARTTKAVVEGVQSGWTQGICCAVYRLMESRMVPVSFLATWQADVPFNQDAVTVGGEGLQDGEFRLPFRKFRLRRLLDVRMSSMELDDVSGAREGARLEIQAWKIPLTIYLSLSIKYLVGDICPLSRLSWRPTLTQLWVLPWPPMSSSPPHPRQQLILSLLFLPKLPKTPLNFSLLCSSNHTLAACLPPTSHPLPSPSTGSTQ